MITTITKEQYVDIMYREKVLHTLLGRRNSYKPEELPSGMNPPTNTERSQAEVYAFVHDPPKNYFLYIDEKNKQATTWTGQKLGTVIFSPPFRSNMGDLRVPVRINAINGYQYYGYFFKSSGDYARVRMVKQKYRK